MGSKEQFAEMQEQGYDIDNSGFMYQEPKPVLEITYTNFGYFRKAKLDGKEISKEEVYKILGIKDTRGLRFEFYAYQFQDSTNEYDVKVYPSNVE